MNILSAEPASRMRGRGIFRTSCLMLAVGSALWIPIAAQAQIPKLAEIPAGMSSQQQASLASRRDALLQRRSELASRVAAHNQQCGMMAETSPQYQSCAAEQSALQSEKTKYIADVQAFNRDIDASARVAQPVGGTVVDLSSAGDGPLVVNPADLKLPERGGGPIEQTPQERVAYLRRRVAVIQQALIRLSQVQQKSEARTEWEDAIQEASKDAALTGVYLSVDLIDTYGLKKFKDGFKAVDKEIGDTVVKLAGETDPNRRAQLHSVIGMMNDSRDEYRAVIDKYEPSIKAMKRASDVLQTADWATKKENDYQKTVEGTGMLMQIAIDEKAVQEFLAKLNNRKPGFFLSKADDVATQQFIEKVSKYAIALKFTTHAINASYDATTVLVGAARLNQLNEQDELYRTRVLELSRQMKSAMEEVKKLEAEMTRNSAVGASSE